jgi:hypothetical protein
VTKEQELCALLDLTFDNYPERPDFAAIRELAFVSKHSSWLITELLKAMFLYGEDPSAFDEYLWAMTNKVDSME